MSVDPGPQGRTKDARTARARRRVWLAAFLFGVSACLLPGDFAFARDRDRDRDRDEKPKAPSPAAIAMPTTLTKTLAVNAIVSSLAMNRTPAAEKTLEQIVTGEIPFGGHSRQAAQTAIVQFALHGTPAADAFLVRILTDPDETIRPGDKGAYPAADLRTDTAHVLALVGSPNARLQLAKLYSQPSTSPAIRSAIEEMIRTPATPNFAAQFEVSRSPDAPEPLKQELQKILVEKNASALKLALRLEVDPMAQAAGAAGNPFSASGGLASPPPNMPALLGKAMQMFGPGGVAPGGAMKTPGGGVTQNAAKMPPDLANAMIALQKAKMGAAAGRPASAVPASPQLMMLELVSQLQNLQPIDPAMVARDLWKPEFVDEISKKLEDDKGNSVLLVSALASLPTKVAREKLKHLLHKERSNGPEEFAKLGPKAAAGEAAKTPAPPPAMRRRGRRKKEEEGSAEQEEKPRAMRFGAMGQLGQTKANRVVEFGKDWLDPGSLVVLKMSVNYEDRPKEKLIFRRSYPTPAYKSPAMERRAKERAEKQKALESTYEWREAIAKAVRQWDERLSAVAESPSESGGTGENAASSDEKPKSASAKSTKAQAKESSKTSKAEEAKTPAGAPAPVPSVAMPLTMHAGGTIAKEYHLRWPQDVATSFGSDLPEPLVVDYVRLQGAGEFGKALTHYRGAIAAIQGAKPKIFRRTIESGTWLDAIQHDETGHRTRSIDVLVTHEPTEDENGKKSKEEALTVEILLVEIETPQSDVTPATHKKEARETTSTTAP